MTITHSDEALRREADSLLDAGLRDTLAKYGEVHVIGSYALRLMTWRDLDIHLVRDPPDLAGFFELGGAVAALLEPHRMHFRDERRVGTPGLPRGLYWGVYLGDERAGAWKIDVWSTDRAGFEGVRRHGERLAARLSEASRHTILTIKSACWRHPEYRRAFSSGDIYSAVLDHGVPDVEGFWRFIGAANSDRATR
jgi:hypothetical protein